MKKKLTLGLTIIMFFFKSLASANYEKTFFDLNIESISGEIINFSDFILARLPSCESISQESGIILSTSGN